MPRTARRDAPGAVHHVLLRGVARCDVFRDHHDRADFVARLERLIKEEQFRCFAWALMPNHVHLVLQTGPWPLSRLMARLGTGYVRAHNRRHGRVGHLFQNRYKALPVSSQAHASTLIRYVCANPLRARLVGTTGELERYPWTALPELLGESPLGIVDRGRVLSWFGVAPEAARRTLLDGLETPASPPPEKPAEQADRLGQLIERECTAHAVSAADLAAGRRGGDLADVRARVVYRARLELKASGLELERRLGIGSAAVSRAFHRGRRLVRLQTQDRP